MDNVAKMTDFVVVAKVVKMMIDSCGRCSENDRFSGL